MEIRLFSFKYLTGADLRACAFEVKLIGPIDSIPNIAFSKTLKNIEWKTAKLEKRDNEEAVLQLRQQAGKDILVVSRGLSKQY